MNYYKTAVLVTETWVDVVLSTGTAVVLVTETWVDVVLTTSTAVELVTETWVDVELTTGTDAPPCLCGWTISVCP
jgi:hypothetical protein